jgi:hypothetical protein
MATLQRWRWRVTDPASGRRYVTRHHMTEADALATDPAAERVEGTLQVLEVADGPNLHSTSSGRTPPED